MWDLVWYVFFKSFFVEISFFDKLEFFFFNMGKLYGMFYEKDSVILLKEMWISIIVVYSNLLKSSFYK